MSGFSLKHIKKYFETPRNERVTYSDPRQNMRKPDWLVQTVADLRRHEGFREYAYPDPLSPLGKKYRARKWGWGFEPGDMLLAKYGENPADGTPWTVGYGFTHGVKPSTRVSKERASHILEQEVVEHVRGLDRLIPRWRKMPVVVQTVLANLIYNMGEGTLADFRNTLDVIDAGRYAEAGTRLTKSLWYKQVGGRARELVERMQTGRIQDQYRVI